MTDTPPDPTVTHVPDEDTGAGFVPPGKSGWLTATIAGTAYRLRAPMAFKEIKQLRLALQAVQDEIEAKQAEQNAALTAYVNYVRSLSSDGNGEAVQDEDLTSTQRTKRDRLAKASKAVSREPVDVADERRLDWWRQVFALLSVDGIPEDFPAWIVDINLPGEVMAHWRSAPLAPGR